MYKKIIVPVDISHMERVEDMVKAARNLGPDAEIILLNAIETVPSHIMAEMPADVLRDARERAENKLKAVADNVSGKSRVKMMDGHAASAILDLADRESVDAIVIGSHKPGWADYLIGSTAARVVRHAKCSVLVLR